MIKNLLIVGVISISLIACTSSEKSTPKAEKSEVKESVEQVDAVVVEPNRLLTLELEGMVCSMGCGGSIRKELNATGAVAQCDFDFEDERATDIATIEFDKDKITADEIVEIVSKINDGQFTVGEVSSEEFHSVEVKEEKSSSKKASTTKIKAATTSSFRLPNLFDLFAGMLGF